LQDWLRGPSQRVAPGVQTPVQLPEAQAYWHADAAHWPPASQVSTVLPLAQRLAPGVQTPPQVPAPWHTKVHVWVVAHWPLASQVWDSLPSQRFSPGTQTPEHVPPTQAKVHGLATHWPLASQVSAVRPVQRVAPGTQTPPQVPASRQAFGQV
jgi:hypothetical protein